MDAPATARSVKINRLLPYWAVFQADLKATLSSWIYRVWVVLSIGAALCYLLYRFGAKQVGGFVQQAPDMLSDVFTWIAFGSVTLIIVMTGGTICGERGTLADSVLSRGVSRIQYFLGKWHARLVAILCTFVVIACLSMAGAMVLLHGENMTLHGSLAAMAVVASLLIMVVTCGVSVSAIANTSVISIGIVWMILYGVGFALSLLPASYPSPDRALQALPLVLKGQYDWHTISRLISGTLSASLLAAVVGMIYFSRRDV